MVVKDLIPPLETGIWKAVTLTGMKYFRGSVFYKRNHD